MKKYKVVFVVVLPILILVLVRSMGVNHFKNDAKRWAEPSVKQSNTITIEQAKELKGKILIVNLNKDTSSIREINGDIQNIPSDSILSKNYVTTIRKHNGPVLLFSSEPALSARIWMVLSQMGCRNLFILTDRSDNEVLKYKFRPDTLSS